MPDRRIARQALGALRRVHGSAAVEYVGLALVVSTLMASIAVAIDSALGERLARAIVARLLDAIAK